MMLECAARFDRLVHRNQMTVVDAGNHHRVHLAQNAALGQHLQAQQLPFAQNP
jgi:mannose-6-phosphate isomerase-like protein (cupin superfamily)